jgi:hypothetical protein
MLINCFCTQPVLYYFISMLCVLSCARIVNTIFANLSAFVFMCSVSIGSGGRGGLYCVPRFLIACMFYSSKYDYMLLY